MAPSEHVPERSSSRAATVVGSARLPTEIDVAILGEMNLTVDGRPVELGGRRQRSLIAVLLLQRTRALSADAIADILWPGEQPASAIKMIHIYVSRLRRQLGVAGSRLTSGSGGYRLILDDQESDAGRFEALLGSARELVTRGHHTAAVAILESAMSLWRGAALADFTYEPFAAAEAGRLEEIRLDAQEIGLRCRLELGDDDLVARARTALAIHPYREGLWSILAIGLYRTGRQADALDAIRSARATLAEELGLDPGPALDQLELAILNHEPWLGQTLEVGSGAQDLPPRMAQLIGRDRELSELRSAVAATRLTTITGAGGTGKTRLALELGWTHEDRSVDIHFVDLSAIRTADLVPAALAAQVGLADDGRQTPLERLADHLRAHRTLLILDNLEQIRAAGPVVAELLGRAADLRIVATSRAALRVRGEREYRLGPLALVEASEPSDAIAASPAVQLFVERMRDAGRSIPVDGTSAPLLAEMCRRLDGLPLAIELAAARIRDLDLASIARGLARQLETLTDGPRDAAQRQQTLRGAIAWSHDLLDSAEARVFRRLSVFEGGGSPAALEAVCGSGMDGSFAEFLAGLVNQSLVVRRDAADNDVRYLMLETIRAFAAEQLALSDDGPDTRRRHAGWFLALAESAENELHGPDSVAWGRHIRAELDNVRAAVGWAIEANEPEVALRLVSSLRFFLPETGNLAEGRMWLARLLELSGDVSDRTRADALNAAGNLAVLQGDLQSAGTSYEASLAIRQAIGEAQPIAASLSNLSQIASGQGDYQRAQTLLEQSLEASRTAGDVWGVAATLGNLADVALFKGDYDRADELFREGLTGFRALGDLASVPTVLSNLGQLAIYRGDYDAASTLLHEAERLVDEVDFPTQANTIRLNLGHLASRRGEFDRARELFAMAYRYSRSSGNRVGVAECLERLGEVLSRTGELRAAVRVWGSAAATRREIGAEMYPVDRAWVEEAVAVAKSTIGDAAFDSEWSVGEVLDQEGLALAHLGTPQSVSEAATDQ